MTALQLMEPQTRKPTTYALNNCTITARDDELVKLPVDIHNHVSCTKGDNKSKVEQLLRSEIINGRYIPVKNPLPQIYVVQWPQLKSVMGQ